MKSKITKSQLRELLEKQRAGQCSEEEEALLTEWFERVPMIEELTFSSYEEKEKIKGEILTAINQTIGQANTFQPRRSAFKLPIFRAAAAVILLLLTALVAYTLIVRPQQSLITFTVPPGVEKMPLTLPDGSQVLLEAGSTIHYPEAFKKSKREVRLSGKGFFSVQRNPQAPFYVSTDKEISVKVLGTSFLVDVRAETQEVYISVVTGHVQVNDAKNSLGILEPGETLSFASNTSTFSRKHYLPEDINAWSNNMNIHLNAARLDEVAILLRVLYHVDVFFEEGETKQYRFFMSFSRSLSIDEVLQMLESASGLTFERTRRIIIVKKR